MKTKILLAFLLFYNLLNAQIVNIPDINFKNALINTGIDTNNDGEIQVTEAHATTSVIVDSQISGGNITDLTGIEAFINIAELNCEGNQLTALDLSSNTALTILYCTNNQLTNLNISSNTALIELLCAANQLTNIDVSNCVNLDLFICGFNNLSNIDISNNVLLTDLRIHENQITTLNANNNTSLRRINCQNNQIGFLDLSNFTNLKVLNCNNNLLVNLDVNQNLDLRSLECNGNFLTNLDISQNNLLHKLFCQNNQILSLNVQNGNNTNFSGFNALDNPNLTCIFVDNIEYSELNWTDIDLTSHFVETQEQCNAVNSIYDEILNQTKIYPNPIINKLTISVPTITTEQINIRIIDVLGKELYKTNIINEQTEIDVSNLDKGIYFLTVSFNKRNQKLTKTIIKL